MKKEEYIKKVEKLRKDISAKEVEIKELREHYIVSNAPAQKGEAVNIVLDSNRKVSGEANSFGIFQDGNVYVTSYKDSKDSKIKYISKPYKSISK